VTERCAICDAAARHRHHLTGRDRQRSYLDPEFTTPLCAPDHSLVHADWTSAGVKLPRGHTNLELATLGLRRVALYFARASEARPESTVLSGLAGWAARCADRLSRSAASLDQYQPHWREVPDV